MTRVLYEVYRDESPTAWGDGRINGEQVTKFLRESIAAFYQAHRRLPAGVVVNRTALDAARKALQALELAQIPVGTSGGCIVPEVWLAVDGEEAHDEPG